MQLPHTYSRPQIRDYGTLLELTTQIDVNLVGAFANVVMATMSGPLASGHVGDPSYTAGGAGGVTGGGGGGPGGAGGGGGSFFGLSLGHGGGGRGGKLPFTGFPVVVVAAIGAAFASMGAALRAGLRRKRA